MNDFVNRFSSAKPGAGEQCVEDVHELVQGMNPGGVGLPTFALPPLPDVGRISEGYELLRKKRGLTPFPSRHSQLRSSGCIRTTTQTRPAESRLHTERRHWRFASKGE